MLLEGLLIVIITILLVYIAGRYREPANLPPGPRPLPILGNLLDIDMNSPYVSFMKIGKKYGDVFTVYLGRERTVVLNNLAAHREALMKGNDFSGRPKTFVQHSTSCGSRDITFQDFDPLLFYKRKLLHSALRIFSVTKLQESVIFEVDELIQKIGNKKEKGFNPKTDFEIAVANIILLLLFGERCEDTDGESLKEVFYINDTIFRLWVSATLLNAFPWLIRIPLKESKDLKDVCKARDKFFFRKYKEHMASFIEGRQRNFTDVLIQAQRDEERQDSKTRKFSTESNIVALLQDVLIGIGTLSAVLEWTVVYLIRYPEVQAKIHKQLDEVVGRGRVPVVDDKNMLSLIEATFLEVIRFSPINTIEVPRKATKDSSIKGYHIPKGTTILLNIFAANHEEGTWKDPYSFNPMRFIDRDGKCRATSQPILAFGAGRRNCPGEAFSRVMVFLFLSRLLHRFEFSLSPGSSLPSLLEGEPSISTKPYPFQICCRDRLATQ